MSDRKTTLIVGWMLLVVAVAMFVVFENWIFAVGFGAAGLAALISTVVEKPKTES